MTRSSLRKTRLPSIATTTKEWDALAATRDVQLRSGQDLSFTHVLKPAVLRLCAGARWTSVVDAGCGTGVLTETLARHAKQIVGVDPSRASIEIARTHSSLSYVVSTIEAFAQLRRGAFTLAVSNMVLATVPQLGRTLGALAALLRVDGRLVFSVPHPWFWPAYWGYDSAPWFTYKEEIAIEGAFRISLDGGNKRRSTHVHRSLEQYIAALHRARLVLENVAEPFPTLSMQRRYPHPWRTPRFLLIRCRRIA
jgi:2-polyprenyl-3-methyl-5-hydroxy-6-metoxy-1,4-benzoquinol methylase